MKIFSCFLNLLFFAMASGWKALSTLSVSIVVIKEAKKVHSSRVVVKFEVGRFLRQSTQKRKAEIQKNWKQDFHRGPQGVEYGP